MTGYASDTVGQAFIPGKVYLVVRSIRGVGWATPEEAHRFHKEQRLHFLTEVGTKVLCLDSHMIYRMRSSAGNGLPHRAYKFLFPDGKVFWTLNLGNMDHSFSLVKLEK